MEQQDNSTNRQNINGKNIINIKDKLTRIFSEDQITKFKSLTRSLDMNIEIDAPSHLQQLKRSGIKTESSRQSEIQGSFKSQDHKILNADFLPSIKRSTVKSSANIKQEQISFVQDLKVKQAKEEAKKMKLKRIIKLAKLEDSDLEEEFQEEEEELMLLAKGKA